jgi:hypothetical protein
MRIPAHDVVHVPAELDRELVVNGEDIVGHDFRHLEAGEHEIGD